MSTATETWGSFRNNVRVTRGLSMRWFREAFAHPFALAFMLAIKPIVWYVLFGSLFEQVSSLPQFPAANYQSFILPGIIVMVVLEYMTIGGNCVVEDLRGGFLQKMWAAPISKSSVVIGRVIVMSGLTLVQMTILLVIAFATGLTVETGIPGLLVIYLMAIMMTAAITSFSLLLAYSVKYEFSFGIISSFFVLPVVFISNAFMPTDLMPDWLGTLADLNPVSTVADGMRALIIDGWVMDAVLPALGLLAASMLVAMTVAILSFTRSIERE